MRAALLAALLLIGVLPPGVEAQAAVSQTVTIEVGADRVERITIVVHGSDAFPESIRVPASLNVTQVRNFVTPIAYETSLEGNDIVVRPRGHSFDWTVDATRSANLSLAPLVSERYFVGAFSVRNDIRLQVRVPEGSTLFAASAGTISADARSLSLQASTTVSFAYSYRMPVDPSQDAEFEEGLFHVVAPATHAAEARMVARIASHATREAASFAGLPLAPPYWVRYAPRAAFEWEDGFYKGGGLIAVRADQLEPTAANGFPWSAASILTHEAFHAISIPTGSGDLGRNTTWWVEGGATFAEQFAVGDDGWRSCESDCYTHNTRLQLPQLDALYLAGGALDPAWNNDDITDADRGRAYDLSGFAVGAYAQRHGREAYQRAWAAYRNATHDASACPCDRALLERILATAGGVDASALELYAPYSSLYRSDRLAFDAAVAPLVADGEPKERPTPRRDPLAPPRPIAGWTPSLAFDPRADVTRRPNGVDAHVAYADLAPLDALGHLPLDDRPLARVHVALDGVARTPILAAREGRLVIYVAAATGAHDLLVEARAEDNETVLARLTSTIMVPPIPRLRMEDAGPGSVRAIVTDGGGPPLPGIEIAFDLEGVPHYVGLTDDTGAVVLPALVDPGRHHIRASASMDGVLVGTQERTLTIEAPEPPTPPAAEPTPVSAPARPSPPAEAPAAVIEPTPASAGADVATGWSILLAAFVLAALVRRREKA